MAREWPCRRPVYQQSYHFVSRIQRFRIYEWTSPIAGGPSELRKAYTEVERRIATYSGTPVNQTKILKLEIRNRERPKITRESESGIDLVESMNRPALQSQTKEVC